MKKRITWLLLVWFVLLAAVAWAQPQIPPAPTQSIYIQDYAGVLDSEVKNKINNLGSKLAAKTKAQIVVVTVKSLEGVPIEEYALQILRQWGIGDKQLNNGVLLFVAVNDRQSRIEVGYGLEGALNDARTGAIQDSYMIPYFTTGDYNKGIWNGYQAVVSIVAKEYNQDISTDAKAHSAAQQSLLDTLPWWAQLGLAAGIFALFIIDWLFLGGSITYLILSLLRFRGGGNGGGGFGGGSGGGGGSSRKW